MLLRLAQPEDALQIARVHVRSWQVAYLGLLPEEYLRNLRAEDRAAGYDLSAATPDKPRTIVAINEREVIGFATTMPSRDPDLPQHSELCALYVDPGWWNRGVGGALISAAREHLVASGFRSALLWVLVGNQRAERFYLADGWTADGHRRTEHVWNVAADEVRYQRPLP